MPGQRLAQHSDSRQAERSGGAGPGVSTSWSTRRDSPGSGRPRRPTWRDLRPAQGRQLREPYFLVAALALNRS